MFEISHIRWVLLLVRLFISRLCVLSSFVFLCIGHFLSIVHIFFFSFSNSSFLFLSFAFACYYRSIMCVDEIILFAFPYENISIPRAFHTIDMLYSFFLRLLSFQCVSDNKQNIKTKRFDFFIGFFFFFFRRSNWANKMKLKKKN